MTNFRIVLRGLARAALGMDCTECWRSTWTEDVRWLVVGEVRGGGRHASTH